MVNMGESEEKGELVSRSSYLWERSKKAAALLGETDAAKELTERGKLKSADIALILLGREAELLVDDGELKDKIRTEIDLAKAKLLDNFVLHVVFEYQDLAQPKMGWGTLAADQDQLMEKARQYFKNRDSSLGPDLYVMGEAGRKSFNEFVRYIHDKWQHKDWDEVLGYAIKYSDGRSKPDEIAFEQLLGSFHANSYAVTALMGYGLESDVKDKQKAIRCLTVRNSGRYGAEILFDVLPIRIQEMLRAGGTFVADKVRRKDDEVDPTRVVTSIMKARSGNAACDMAEAVIQLEDNLEYKRRIEESLLALGVDMSKSIPEIVKEFEKSPARY